LDETEKILEKNSASEGERSWSKSWMNVLQSKTGPDPVMPEYGFGDATSCRLIEAIVAATRKTGAVRHGAECFNYWFPQELDDEYLVVWEGFQMLPGCQRDPPWTYMKMEDLHHFLLERIAEGYSFPLNPVWPVRDAGWFEVHMHLMRSEAARGPCDAWYPQGSGIREKIEKIHERFPKGFQHAPSHTGVSDPFRTDNRSSLIEDVDPLEHADVLHFKVRPAAPWSRARWKVMSLESIMNPFTPHAPLGSPGPSFCPRKSVASSRSRLSTRRGTFRMLGEDLDDRHNSKTLLTEDLAEDQNSTSQHSAEDDAMLQPALPSHDARPVPLHLDLAPQELEWQPTITRHCSTPGGQVAQAEETDLHRSELVRSAASTPSWRSFQKMSEEVFEDEDADALWRTLLSDETCTPGDAPQHSKQ